jgi:type IX secretion system PorP/SprF family membrane protein
LDETDDHPAKMKKYISGLFLAFILKMIPAGAQDIGFTQTMATPMYINPAYAGIQQNMRGSFQIRDQWPGIGSGYLGFAASADVGLPKIKSGLGLMFTNTSSNYGQLNSTSLNAIYAYQINFNDDVMLRMGINASFFQRVFHVNDTLSVQFSQPTQTTNLIPDFGAGLLLYAGQYYGGIAVMNLFEPIQSFNGDPDETLKRRYTLQVGNFTDIGTIIVNPNILFTTQGNVTRFTPGVNFILSPFVLGTSLRLSSQNEDALDLLFGLYLGKFKICYSYDLNISSNPGAAPGSHELSLVVQLSGPKNLSDNPRIRHLRATF